MFIGNLDSDVDEKLLHDTFSQFGVIVSTKITRDPATGMSKGFGFINYDNFESSDAAIQAMNGQFLCNREISVGYAMKKDGKGERHGTAAERLLASQGRKNQAMPIRSETPILSTGGRGMTPLPAQQQSAVPGFTMPGYAAMPPAMQAYPMMPGMHPMSLMPGMQGMPPYMQPGQQYPSYPHQ